MVEDQIGMIRNFYSVTIAWWLDYRLCLLQPLHFHDLLPNLNLNLDHLDHPPRQVSSAIHGQIKSARSLVPELAHSLHSWSVASTTAKNS